MKSFPVRFLTLVHTYRTYLLLALVWPVFFSCKEDEDEESPKVIISQPYENQAIGAADTIQVQASITDNEQLVSVVVELLRSDFTSTGRKDSYPASGTSMQFATNFAMNSPFEEGGTYYIAVRALDGNNVGSGYRKILLSAVPRVLERLMVATAATNNVRVYSKVPGEGWEEHLNLQLDFAGAALNYRQNIFGIAGGQVGDATFYATGEWIALSAVQGFGVPSLPFFLGLRFDPKTEEFMLLQREPSLRVFDKNAFGLNGFLLQPEHLPVDAFATSEFYFVNEKPITTPFHSLAVYARPGLLMAFLAVDGPVKGVFRKSASEVYVWMDGTGGARLKILNTNTYLFSDVYSRPGEMLKAVDELSQGQFVFSTSGGMYRYNFNTGATVVVSQSVSPALLKYEGISGTIYTANGTVLQQRSITGQLLSSENFDQAIRFIGFDYNR